jgi:hypothetical protein
MKTNRPISILLLLFVPLAIRSCAGTPEPTRVEYAENSSTAYALTSEAEDTRRAEDAATASQEADMQTAAPILTRIAAQLTLESTLATPTDVPVAFGATPEAAALAALKAWATVPYQNERAEALDKTDRQARIRVSAEFKDSGNGAWVRQESITLCSRVSATGWKCLPFSKFGLSATVTPAP